MRTGKLTQTAWRRSVRRQLRTKQEEVISVPSPYENCSGIRTENGWSLCGRTPALPEMVRRPDFTR